MRLARLLCGFGLALAFLACENPVTWNEKPADEGRDTLLGQYRTGHFVYLYDTKWFRENQIIANGKSKEAHLERICRELKVSFHKEIMVRLTSTLGRTHTGEAYLNEPYFITESLDYFHQDNGHEIAHIVSFEALGKPDRRRFFLEGVAAAHELDSEPKLHRLCGHHLDSWEMESFLESNTESTRSADVDYDVAAAFVEWLELEFGMERFKTFYRDLETFQESSLSSLYEKNFGLTATALHGKFVAERFAPLQGSRHCEN